jgi:hypothetical protein
LEVFLMVQEYPVIVYASSDIWAWLIANRHDIYVLLTAPLWIAAAVWVYRHLRRVTESCVQTRMWLYDLDTRLDDVEEMASDLSRHQEMLDHMARMRAAKAAKKQAAQAS